MKDKHGLLIVIQNINYNKPKNKDFGKLKQNTTIVIAK